MNKFNAIPKRINTLKISKEETGCPNENKYNSEKKRT